MHQNSSTRARPTLEVYGEVLTLEELATVLFTSPTTIKRRLRTGTFPIRPLLGIDKRKRWSRTAVREYLDTGGTP